MYEKTTLDNGLRVLTVNMPHVQSVSVAFFLGAGSRYEEDEQAGISHFLEHMCFKGTKKRPLPQDLSEAIERVGGYMNAATDREMTIYWAKVARPYFMTALDLLADMILNSVHDVGEMEKERKVILEELASVNDSPHQKVDLLIDEAVWPGNPLGRDIAGTRDSVNGITREMTLSYLDSQYTPNNTVVAVAGNIDHGEVADAVHAEFKGWMSGTPRPWTPSKSGRAQPVVALENRKTEQAHFCLAIKGLSSTHPDRYELDMLNVVLGEGMSSRLFLELREKHGLAYDAHSAVSHFLDDGALTIYAGVDPARIKDAVKMARQQIDGLKMRVPATELDKAKAMTKGRLLLRTEDSRSMAGWVGTQELLSSEVKTVDQVAEIIDGITAEGMERVANDIFVRPLHLAVVGPFRSALRFERLLD
ncbi:insulinase family protein [Dehalococcoidia bacterium]|nr:insulinase family protein [Dehalococcoidia bacterium]